jgi:hypothetical protein
MRRFNHQGTGALSAPPRHASRLFLSRSASLEGYGKLEAYVAQDKQVEDVKGQNSNPAEYFTTLLEETEGLKKRLKEAAHELDHEPDIF